jgi:hypothetical protein
VEGEGGRRRDEHLPVSSERAEPTSCREPNGASQIREGQSSANRRAINGNQRQLTAVTSCHEPNGFRQPNRPKLGRDNQRQSTAVTSCHEPSGFRQPNRPKLGRGNQGQSTAVTSCHEPSGFRQPNRCLMAMKADSTRSALASLGEAKTGLEKENQASILARSTPSSSGMASQSGVFCRRAGHPKLGRGVPN